jgi:nitroimidazol reductase NimA-like FMN-containing flavoprotein (pyridoxamine 5'-phosphate oxidase superfamily)
MKPYHLRRAEKAITDQDELRAIIEGQKYMTLAMSKDNIPYLVTMNYGYDAEQQCFYFHSAQKGKKIDFLSANPQIWGQIIEDCGYRDDKCDHAFRSIYFEGTVTFVEDVEEKSHALRLMIDQLEPDPEPVKERLVVEKRVKAVNIGKVTVSAMTGKQNGVQEED